MQALVADQLAYASSNLQSPPAPLAFPESAAEFPTWPPAKQPTESSANLSMSSAVDGLRREVEELRRERDAALLGRASLGLAGEPRQSSRWDAAASPGRAGEGSAAETVQQVQVAMRQVTYCVALDCAVLCCAVLYCGGGDAAGGDAPGVFARGFLLGVHKRLGRKPNSPVGGGLLRGLVRTGGRWRRCGSSSAT
eukprot:1192426-Prorocentrum_minimum.AAC.1